MAIVERVILHLVEFDTVTGHHGLARIQSRATKQGVYTLLFLYLVSSTSHLINTSTRQNGYSRALSVVVQLDLLEKKLRDGRVDGSDLFGRSVSGFPTSVLLYTADPALGLWDNPHFTLCARYTSHLYVPRLSSTRSTSMWNWN